MNQHSVSIICKNLCTYIYNMCKYAYTCTYTYLLILYTYGYVYTCVCNSYKCSRWSNQKFTTPSFSTTYQPLKTWKLYIHKLGRILANSALPQGILYELKEFVKITIFWRGNEQPASISCEQYITVRDTSITVQLALSLFLQPYLPINFMIASSLFMFNKCLIIQAITLANSKKGFGFWMK